VWAALKLAADQLTGQGDRRSRGQIMADTLVERVTGQAEADDVAVSVNVTISDEALLAGGHEPAWLTDYGHVPAALARRLIDTATRSSLATLRRLYVNATGQLAAMDSTSTAFPKNLATFIDLRDQTCRTPWCDAPIRHHDHVRSLLAGGPPPQSTARGSARSATTRKRHPAGPRDRPARRIALTKSRPPCPPDT